MLSARDPQRRVEDSVMRGGMWCTSRREGRASPHGDVHGPCAGKRPCAPDPQALPTACSQPRETVLAAAVGCDSPKHLFLMSL